MLFLLLVSPRKGCFFDLAEAFDSHGGGTFLRILHENRTGISSADILRDRFPSRTQPTSTGKNKLSLPPVISDAFHGNVLQSQQTLFPLNFIG